MRDSLHLLPGTSERRERIFFELQSVLQIGLSIGIHKVSVLLGSDALVMESRKLSYRKDVAAP